MKNILYLLSLALILVGCEKYELETYPTLDGTYRVSSVTMTTSDGETIHYVNAGDEVYFPVVDGPLEEIIINETKFGFSGVTMSAIYNENDFGSPWGIDYNIRFDSDLVTGSWSRVTVTNYEPYSRSFNIIEDGLEYVILNRNTQYDEINGVEREYTIVLYREGP